MSNGDREGKSVWVWPSKNKKLSGFTFSLPKHPGVDIGAVVGENVWSPGAGTVVYAGWSTVGYGNLVVVETKAGYKFYLAHLSEIDQRVGDTVRAGEIIGKAGSTGNSTGPHIHFEVRKPGGGFLNPLNISWGSGSPTPGGPPQPGTGDDDEGEGIEGDAAGSIVGNIRISTPAGEITVSNPFKGIINYVESIKWGNILAVGAGVVLVVVGVYSVTQGELAQKAITVVKDVSKAKNELPI